MFGFLKEKLKQTVDKLTKEVDQATEKVEPTEEQKKEIIQEIKKEQEEKKSFFSKIKEKFTKKEDKETINQPAKEKKEVILEKKQVDVVEKKVEIEERIIPHSDKIPKEILVKKIEEGEKEIDEIVAKKQEQKESKAKKESKKVIKESKKEQKSEEEPKEEQKGFFARLKDKFIAKEEKQEEKEKTTKPFEVSEEEVKEFENAFKEQEEKKEIKEQTNKEESEEEIIPVITETEQGETVFEIQEKEESGIFSALKNTIFKTSLSEEKFEELFWELEMVLLENNVAVEVIEVMKQNLKHDLVEKKILRGEINTIIFKSLQKSVEQTFHVPPIDFIERVKEKKPFVVVFVGINGSGKTTTIAKMAHKLKENKLSCVIAAGDTFRAAAIQQLEEHANRLKVKMIKHEYGSDPAAVGFDAIKYAQAHNIDCVLIDTAGRLHSNVNLMDEMKKIIRVTKPDFKVFIGEAITGNDCVDQARKFHEAIGIDGIVLAKADVDEKGGAALSISYVTKKPIIFIGTGQGYNDLQPFDKEKVMEQIGLG